MNTNESTKEMVREKYSEIALQSKEVNASSCCGSGGCSGEVYNIMTDEYDNLKGYNKDADLKLGCGLPTEYAGIKTGDTVVDLGSGAGNDCFVARHETGPEGRVIGIDFTTPMIDRARDNAEKLGFDNVEFRYGDIEKIPLSVNTADVVVSNCVLNLVPDKQKAFSEMLRVLKPGGHFSISDIVLEGELPDNIRNAAEMYAGCISGALQKGDYMQVVEEAGFEKVSIQKQKIIVVPDDILERYLSKEDIDSFKNSGTGIYSITVYGEKPEKESCCGVSGCCE